MSSEVSMKIKWSGSEYSLEAVPLSSTVLELKNLIKEQTGVLPGRQKLCGISLKGTNVAHPLFIHARSLNFRLMKSRLFHGR